MLPSLISASKYKHYHPVPANRVNNAYDRRRSEIPSIGTLPRLSAHAEWPTVLGTVPNQENITAASSYADLLASMPNHRSLNSASLHRPVKGHGAGACRSASVSVQPVSAKWILAGTCHSFTSVFKASSHDGELFGRIPHLCSPLPCFFLIIRHASLAR